MKFAFGMFTLLTVLCNSGKAQFLGFGSESVEIYGVKFKAKDVTGQSKFNGSAAYYRTSILNPLIEQKESEFLQTLGTYRSDKSRAETLPLFNLSSEKSRYPLLDSIDFYYYANSGFRLAEQRNPSFLTDTLYTNLLKRIETTNWAREQKKILFEDKYRKFRDQIILSRFDTINKPFAITQKITTKTTAELKAKVDSILIGSNLQANAQLRTYMSNLVDKSITLQGFYCTATLTNDYIGTINYFIRTTAPSKLGGDKFAYYLKEYVNSKNAAANTELVAIKIVGKFDQTKVSADSIALALQANFQIPADKALKIAASINFSFTKNQTTTFTNNFNSVFIIRYFTSAIIDDVKLAQALTEKLLP